MPEKIAFAVCSNLINELKLVLNSDSCTDAIPVLMPANCLKKCVINDALFKRLLSGGSEKYDKIELISGCFYDKNGLIKSSPEITVYPEPLCFKLFINPGIIDSFIKNGSYLIMPAWLLRWKFNVEKIWGFNKSCAIEFFAESRIKKLTLINTGIFAGNSKIDLSEKLSEFCEYMGLPGENIDAGLHYFKAIIDSRLNSWRLEKARENHKRDLSRLGKKLSYSMAAFEFTDEILSGLEEKNIVEKITGLFFNLFAPERIIYYSLSGGTIKWLMSPAAGRMPDGGYEYRPPAAEDEIYFKKYMPEDEAFEKPRCFDFAGGFCVYIGDAVEKQGFVIVEGLKFPSYTEDYIELAGVIANISSIALSNARKYQKILRAVDDAQKANKAKDFFLANMSHELRTPIASIIGFCELLTDGGLPSAAREFAAHIKTSAGMLLSQVSNILDFSKIEAGRVEVENINFSLVRLIQEVSDIIKVQADLKFIKFQTELISNVDNLVGDYGKLRQVLVNLTANAVKFSEKGTVILSAHSREECSGKVFVKFSVKDEGPGIVPDKLKIIFKPFSQADGSVTRRFGGTGLGLSISESLVKIMGGSAITVESSPGAGSCFSFVLEFKTFASQNLNGGVQISEFEAGHSEIEFKGGANNTRECYKILAVDDNPMNLELISTMIKRLGHNAVKACGGEAALELFKNMGADGVAKIDLIIMDLQMPGMDGLQTSRKIRESGIEVPIVLLSAINSVNNDASFLAESGINSFLSKPISMKDLISVFQRYIKTRRPAQ